MFSIPVNQRRLYNDYSTCSKRHGVGVWNKLGSRYTNVAGSLGLMVMQKGVVSCENNENSIEE